MTICDNHIAAIHKLAKHVRRARREGGRVRSLRRAIRLHHAMMELHHA